MTCHIMPWPLCSRSVVGATTITTVGPGRSKPPWHRVSAVGQSICIVGSKEAATWRHSLGVLSPGSAYCIEPRDDIEMGDLHFYQYRYKCYKYSTSQRTKSNFPAYIYAMMDVCLCVFPCMLGIYIPSRCISCKCHIKEPHLHIYALNASSLRWLSAVFGAMLPWSSPEVKLSRVWSW